MEGQTHTHQNWHENNSSPSVPFSTDRPSSLQPHSPSCALGTETDIWPDIYQPETNIVVWQRQITDNLFDYAEELLQQHPVCCQMSIAPDDIVASLVQRLPEHPGREEFANDIALLADMFCCLFDTERVGLRLATLDTAMCPRFHVDHVPCRLVTTYTGSGTQWLNNDCVDRSRLGRGSVDAQGNYLEPFSDPAHINNAAPGDVTLLKGEKWYNNEGNGLVHRSPAITADRKRLVLTLDFA